MDEEEHWGRPFAIGGVGPSFGGWEGEAEGPLTGSDPLAGQQDTGSDHPDRAEPSTHQSVDSQGKTCVVTGN